MKQYDNKYKYRDYILYNDNKNMPYDWERKGLLTKLVPQNFIESKNTIFQAVLKVIETPFTYILKKLAILNNWRNFYYWNR